MYKETFYINCKKCGSPVRAEIPENTCGCNAHCTNCGYTNYVSCRTWTCGRPEGIKVM